MRLHGGYYKKDADGKRIIPQEAAGQVRPLLEESALRKRKQDGVNGKRGQVPPISLGNTNGSNGDNSNGDGSESPPLHKKPFLDSSESNGQSESSSPPPSSFRCLPPPDTSQLLANLERKTKEEQQAAVAAVAAAAVQLPTPPPPPPPPPPLAPPTPFPCRPAVSPLTPISSPPALVIKPASVQPSHASALGLPLRRSRRPHLVPNPDRDATPRVGAQFQADIPDLRADRHSSAFLTPDPADRIWDPAISVALETRSPCGPLQVVGL